MKRILLFAMMIMLGIGSTFAQQKKGNFDPEKMLQKQVDELKQALNLTPDQVTKITPILKSEQEKQRAQMQKMHEGGGKFDREKMKADHQKMMAETDAKIKPIFKGDQVKKLEAFRQDQQKRMQERMHKRKQ